MSEPNQVNRKHKDRLIRFLFQKKKDLLSLYNAINHSQYENEDDLDIYTMEDYVYMGMKNDLSFLIDWNLNIYEHQSTWNPNMPLRGYLYTAAAYKKYIELNHLDIYSSTIQKIPIPQYYVLYNGETTIEDEVVLRLTDAMYGTTPAETSCAEFVAHVLNINEGHNQEILNACPLLKEYAQFVSIVRKHLHSGLSARDAIDAATAYCIAHNILTDVLLANKAEVTDMVLTEYDEAFHIESEKKISYNEGFEDGLHALVHSLFEFIPDFDTLYKKIRTNPAYENVTPEQVRKYYDPLVSKNVP